MTIPALLDCDPGHDDALALLLALASPELELLGVSAVAGNVELSQTAANALRIRERSSPDILLPTPRLGKAEIARQGIRTDSSYHESVSKHGSRLCSITLTGGRPICPASHILP